VHSGQLTDEQADQLRQQIAHKLRYLNRLVDRLTMLGFSTFDPLWQDAIRARNAVQALHVTATRCGPVTGVGHPPPPPK
jgi:hypothetical protein